MKAVAVILGLLLAALSAGAATIDMNMESETFEPDVSVSVESVGVFDIETIRLLNEDPYVHLLIDGYEKVGVRFGSEEYTVIIENDRITRIEPGITDADYIVDVGFEQALFLYSHRNAYPRVELLRLGLLEKDIPLKVVMRFAGSLMKNE